MNATNDKSPNNVKNISPLAGTQHTAPVSKGCTEYNKERRNAISRLISNLVNNMNNAMTMKICNIRFVR